MGWALIRRAALTRENTVSCDGIIDRTEELTLDAELQGQSQLLLLREPQLLQELEVTGLERVEDTALLGSQPSSWSLLRTSVDSHIYLVLASITDILQD